MASYNTVITNEGAALLASVIANQGTLTFSEMRFSTTDYDGVEQTLTVGTFAGVFITAAAAGSVVDATTIKVGVQFDNSGIVGDHPLYSIGIVGTDGNTTALIAVCTTTNPDIIRAALTGVSTYAFNVNLAVSSTLDIHVYGTTAAVIYDTDIIDTLTSPATNKPLSANQGRVLADNLSNRNLLDNPWFTVNQRGATSGDFALNKYWFDRWKTAYNSDQNGTWSLTSAGLSIDTSTTPDNSRFDQIFEAALDATRIYTASVMLSDGTVVSATGNPEITISHSDFTVYANSGFFRILIPTNKQLTIRAVKLEVGSISTLHLDVAPDYTTELLKCQRYFYRMFGDTNTFVGMGFSSDAIYALIDVKYPVTMRDANVSLSSTGSFIVRESGTNHSASALASSNKTQQQCVIIVTTTGLTAHTPCYAMGTTSWNIDFSADL